MRIVRAVVCCLRISFTSSLAGSVTVTVFEKPALEFMQLVCDHVHARKFVCARTHT